MKSKNIFQKNPIDTNDLFISPIDISDHTIPNGNSIMLSNLSRFEKSWNGKLSNSLNGYLNLFKSHMLTVWDLLICSKKSPLERNAQKMVVKYKMKKVVILCNEKFPMTR